MARGSSPARPSASASVKWPIALAPADGEHLRLGAGLRMDIERAAVGDDQAFGRERLDAEIIGARRDRAFDPGAQQILEHAEQRVLQMRWSAPAAG